MILYMTYMINADYYELSNDSNQMVVVERSLKVKNAISFPIEINPANTTCHQCSASFIMLNIQI